MREVEAYRLFANTPGIIHAVDHAVATERGGGGGIGTGADDGSSKTVYILLPYYRRGNLQDMINANLVSGSRFPERQIMMLFLDVCKAVREMHHYKGPGREVQRMEMGDEVEESGRKGKKGKGKAGSKGGRAATVAAADEEDEGEQQRPLMDGEDRIGGGGKGGRSYVHRDIKPGMSLRCSRLLQTVTVANVVLLTSN